MIYKTADKPEIRVKEKVAVVLLSYNSRAYIEQFIPYVLKSTYKDFKLILVDNASTDDTLGFMQRNYPQIDILNIEVNKGFTNGFVESLPCIKAEYYALVTSDVEVAPDWLEPMVEAMDADRNLAACQPKIKAFKDRDSFEYAGATGGFMDKWGYMFCRGRIFDSVEKDKGQYDEPMDIFWASGAVFLLRADVYHEVGGFDNDYFAHMEEIDLCWKIHRAAYNIKVIPASEVFHVGGSVILYGSSEKTYRNYRNNLILLTKHLPTFRLIWMLPWRLILDFVSAMQALLGGRKKECAAIFKAHRDYFASWGKWLGKRSEVLQRVPYRKIKGIYNRSIIWQYFLRGKKTFSNLPGKLSKGE
ncbi:MAG: glycosyltransferase family 2 protein [Candidatus Neomarinimicrobiota bacterium]